MLCFFYKKQGDVMEIKYKKCKDELRLYVSGELDECSASNAKTILDNIIENNLNTKKVIFYNNQISYLLLILTTF